MNVELKQKLCESLQKTTYNETIFNAVKKELKFILDSDYYPKFLSSKIFQENKRLILNAIYTSANKTTTAASTNGIDEILIDKLHCSSLTQPLFSVW